MKKQYKTGLIILCTLLTGLMVYITLILPLKKSYSSRHVNIHGVYLINPIKIKNFELTDQHNNKFTNEDLKNHWNLVFFGFTHCQMVCPVTLSVLNSFYQDLEKKIPKSNLPQIVFITVDPERDTQEKLNQYINQFNHHFIGARTSPEKTADIEKQFHVVVQKNQPVVDNQYQINHSPEIVLINPNGEIQAYFSFPPQVKNLVTDYLAILKK